jgi:hypothetical protein
MKYRSLLLHTCWGISFCLLSSNASLNFCLNLFLKMETFLFPSLSSPICCVAQLGKSGRAPYFPSPSRGSTPHSAAQPADGPTPARLHLIRCQVEAAGHPPPRTMHGSDSGSDPELAPHACLASCPLARAPLPCKISSPRSRRGPHRIPAPEPHPRRCR